MCRNQNKKSSADWSVANLRGKTIKTKQKCAKNQFDYIFLHYIVLIFNLRLQILNTVMSVDFQIHSIKME